MAHKDIISRRTLKRLTADLARHLLNVDGEVLELLETQHQRVEDRRADLVARMRGADGAVFVLHVEIASKNEADMHWRMLRYRTDIRLSGIAEPLRQCLVYIGANPLRMAAGISEPGLDYRYTLVDMHQVDCAGLLAQDNPDALVLAILCDFDDRNPQDVVNHIVARLRALHPGDDKGLREYLSMLEVLSQNRDLESAVREAENSNSSASSSKRYSGLCPDRPSLASNMISTPSPRLSMKVRRSVFNHAGSSGMGQRASMLVSVSFRAAWR
jgi:hypothetical protein